MSQEQFSIVHQYQALSRDISHYLTQTYSREERIPASSENYKFFLNEALLSKEKVPKKTEPYKTKIQENTKIALPKLVETSKSSSPIVSKETVEKVKPLAIDSDLQKSIPSVQLSSAKKTSSLTVRASKTFALEPLPIRQEESFKTIQDIFVQLFPKNTLILQPLDDIEAITIKQEWKKNEKHLSVMVIASEEPAHHQFFLERMVKGLTERLIPAGLVEANVNLTLENIPLIIVTLRAKTKLSNLDHFPHIVLDAIENYLHDTALKRQLWNDICHRFSNKI